MVSQVQRVHSLVVTNTPTDRHIQHLCTECMRCGQIIYMVIECCVVGKYKDADDNAVAGQN